MRRLIALSLLAWSAFAAVTIVPNDAAIIYSPYNWVVTATSAKTINAGAYLRVIFSGTSAALTTDTANNAAPFSQLWARVDGQPWTKLTLAAGNPTLSVATGLDDRKHLLEVVVKSTSETLTRWSATAQTMVTLTGIVLDDGATVTAPTRRTKNILIYGDSISEGVRSRNATATNDTDRNDAIACYSYGLWGMVDAEVGIVGFGGTGITHTGTGSVPALPNSYNLIYPTAARSFSPTPDLVIYNEGQNDGANDITAGLETVINAVITASPNSKQLVLVPFSSAHKAQVQAAVAAIASGIVTWADTVGWWNVTDSSDTIHPYDYSHIGKIAPKLAAVVQKLLYQGTVGMAW